MPLIKCEDIYSVKPYDYPLNLAFGNFDGVHVGHKKIINCLKNKCLTTSSEKTSSALITFDPHPLSFFYPQTEDFLLFKSEQKFKLLLNEEIDVLYVIKFDDQFCKIPAEEFLRILVQNFNAKHIITGINCRFGNKALGNCNLIKNLSEKYFYTFSIIEKEILNEQKIIQNEATNNSEISSSVIRTALKNGDLKKVTSCLGRLYFITGEVIIGNKRGKSLGFPTCNISLEGIIKPKFGVYFVRVQHNDKYYYGISNIGLRPTFGNKNPLAEVHIFDFDEMIYGQIIKIELLEFIREEKKFTSIEELIFQINQDILFIKNNFLIKSQITNT